MACRTSTIPVVSVHQCMGRFVCGEHQVSILVDSRYSQFKPAIRGSSIKPEPFQAPCSISCRISGLSCPLDQFDLVTLRRVDEGEEGAGGGRGGTVRILQAEFCQVPAKFLEAVHLERQMGQVRLDLNRAAGWEAAKFNLFLALGRLEKDQFRAAR